MIHSMTAFARGQHQGAWGSVVCEIRSINHRYLDVSIRLPENFQTFETHIRNRLRKHISRGKIECYIRFHPNAQNKLNFTINDTLALTLSNAAGQIAKYLDKPSPINPMDILRWPGVLDLEEDDLSAIEIEMEKLVESTFVELVAARAREGLALQALCIERLSVMGQEVARVRKRLPSILDQQRARLMNRFADAKLELDSQRLEQELVLFAQKIDVSEELERIDTHILEVKRILKHGGAIGRRLDFLMQELNREANTLGSKSVDVDTTRAAMELKVLIEQIREQVQNVE